MASYSLWALAGVEADAFSPRRRTGAFRHLKTRLIMLVALFGFERRTHQSGLAVCLLDAKPARLLLAAGGLACLVVLVCGASAPAGLALLGVVVCIFGPALARNSRLPGNCWPVARRGLGAGSVYLHSLASARPGAGAELMQQVAAEADREQLTLVLDADNEILVLYYEQFGFSRRAPAYDLGGARRSSIGTRMWRLPAAYSLGGPDGR